MFEKRRHKFERGITRSRTLRLSLRQDSKASPTPAQHQPTQVESHVAWQVSNVEEKRHLITVYELVHSPMSLFSFLFYNVLFCACARRTQRAKCSHVAGQCHILFIFCSIYIHTQAYHIFHIFIIFILSKPPVEEPVTVAEDYCFNV